MNGNIDINSSRLATKVVIYSIRIGMPILTVILLLLISPSLEREYLNSSKSMDLVIRLTFCFMFCAAYANMPFISKSFWMYSFPGLQKTNIVINPRSLPLSIFLIMTRFLVLGGATLFVVDSFLPIFKGLEMVISIINGLIFALPALAQYLHLRQKENP